MTYNLNLNQVKMVEWDLSVKASILMCGMVSLSSWATAQTYDNEVYYVLYRSKIMAMFPVLGKSMPTISKYIAELESKDLIESTNKNFQPAYRLTAKGKEWVGINKNPNGAEISPEKENKKPMSLAHEVPLEDVGEEYQKLLETKCYEYCKTNNIRFEEMKAFSSWHIAKGTTYKNWYQAFVNWCNRDTTKKKNSNVGEKNTRGKLDGSGDCF